MTQDERPARPSNVFPSPHPLVQHKVTVLRDRETEPRKFRELVSEVAAMLTYEATMDLPLRPQTVETPLSTAEGHVVQDQIGLVPILRAGLGMVNGAWNLIPQAEVWHIGLYRDERTLQPVEYYNKLPVMPTVSVSLVLDPMLATGGSAVATVDILKDWGAERIKFVGIIAAPEGVQAMQDAHPDVPIHVAVIDERLTTEEEEKWLAGFIWPGLGDAGDRQFGTG